MKNIQFTKTAKTGMQVFLLLSLLLFSFGPVGVNSAYALGNDNFANATTIVESSISFTDSLNVSSYNTEASEVAPPGICGNDNHTLELGYQTAWYKFTPLTAQLVSFDTIGSSYDTYIAVWKGTALNNLTLVGCDDDTYAVFQSQVAVNFTQTDVNNGTTFYVQVAKYNCSPVPCTPSNPAAGGYSLVFHANFYNVDVTIGGTQKGIYNLPDGEVRKQSYSGVNTGPALITTVLSDQLISSMRVIYSSGGKNRSYSELMGFPAEKATTEYYFPWYTTNTATNSQLRIVNVGAQPTIVEVRIKGVKKGSYALNPGKSKLVVYSGVNSGPVWVKSTVAGVNIIASMRVLYKYKGAVTSYSEMMGLPATQLTTTYLFPWYKSAAGLTSQLRVANVSSQSTTVQVYIAGVPKGSPFTLAAGAAKQIGVYTSVNNGPVKVVSMSPPVNILASMKQTYKLSSIPQSYSEMMGYPTNQLSTEYQFPWYTNNTTILSSLRIVNVDDLDSTNVEVYVGGNLQAPINNLAAGASVLVSYGLDDGPVRVVSTNPSANILVSMLITYKQGGKGVSYSELTGIHVVNNSPDTVYLFPWYTNSSTIKSELRFGYP